MFSSRPSNPSAPGPPPGAAGDATAGTAGVADATEPDTARLIAQLDQDRLWLLRQIDAGCWGEWRLDLAALERELGQLLDQLRERTGS
jgi:hypothetical protein